MSIMNLINKRESCRNYSDKKVEKEKLITCIEAARLAPSACNSQPWSFVIVNNPNLSPVIAKLTQEMGMNKFTDKCPAFIVVCEEPAVMSAKIGGMVKKQQYAQMDIGLATANICLCATEQGLSTCILGWFNEKEVKNKLNIPKNKRIRLIIAVGYSNTETVRKKVRKNIDDMMTYL